MTATAVLKLTTPHEKQFGTAPLIKNSRVFGCAAYAHQHAGQRSNKSDTRAEHGINRGKRNYMHRIYIPESKKLVTTKDATLNEDELPLVRRQKASVFVKEGYPENRLANDMPKMAPRNDNKFVLGEFDSEEGPHRNRKSKFVTIWKIIFQRNKLQMVNGDVGTL